MAGFVGLSGVGSALLAYMVKGAPIMQYRQAYVSGNPQRQWIGPTAATPGQPIGTPSPYFDAIEDVATDSAAPDLGTGFVGGYAPATGVHVLILRRPERAEAYWVGAGLQLKEGNVWAVLLVQDISPARFDLIVAPDGTRYVVGEQQQAIGIQSTVIGYLVTLERRDPTSEVYRA